MPAYQHNRRRSGDLKMSYTAGLAWAYPIDRSEADLAIHIRKATSNEETAPKRKHVRACIVFTWDHKSSQSFWSGMKVYVNLVLCELDM